MELSSVKKTAACRTTFSHIPPPFQKDPAKELMEAAEMAQRAGLPELRAQQSRVEQRLAGAGLQPRPPMLPRAPPQPATGWGGLRPQAPEMPPPETVDNSGGTLTPRIG